jgi:hypothetical protein
MALTPLSPGGADPAYQAGSGATPLTPELRTQANRTSPSGADASLANRASRILSDSVTLSAQAQRLGFSQDTARASEAASSSAGPQSTDGDPLTEGEQKQVAELKKRDREVRQHEQAHQAVGGQYASAPSYDYQQGPDGKRYVVGGEVQIDASPVPGDPAATIEKMRVVKAAALAPAEPSAQDRKVAAAADATAQQARAEQAAQDRDAREAAARGNAPSDPSQPSSGPQSPQTQSPPGQTGAAQAETQATPFGFGGGVQSPQISQANGAYAATTRAQAISQLVGVIA